MEKIKYMCWEFGDLWWSDLQERYPRPKICPTEKPATFFEIPIIRESFIWTCYQKSPVHMHRYKAGKLCLMAVREETGRLL